MSTKSDPNVNWAETLAQFLSEQPGIEAVRIDAGTRKIAVATLGEVDYVQLQARLAETIKAIEDKLASAAEVPAGFAVRQEGKLTEMAGLTCSTAAAMWKWREYEWPPINAEIEEIEEPEWRELAAFAAVCGVFGIAGFVVEKMGVGPAWLAHALYGVALIAGGWDATVDTWENIKQKKLDIHFLMLAVAVGAVCIGAWGEAVLLLFLFSSSGAMEDYAMDRTQREVGSLLKTAPKQATVVRNDGREQLVKIEEIGIGDRVRVKPGEAFAADGVVSKGKSAADESAITGEARPVEKAVGDQVFSGTINLWGAVDFDVARLPSESTLQKIIRLIQTAQKLRAPSERFTDRFGGGYTFVVLGVCAVMFFIWWLGFHVSPFTSVEGSRSAFYRAMTLLVVMSPCALVLSIPSAILAAIAWGAKHGVLFRGGAAIEKLAEIKVVALDKTGTLTTGELDVVGHESYPPGREHQVLELAYALEVKSQHPLARAIVRHAKANGVKELDTDDFQSLTGQGVRGTIDGAQCLLGRRELLESGPLAEWAKALPPAPPEMSEVWVIGRDLVGRILLRDQIRAESKEVLTKLKAAGIRSVMLTGDRRHAAESVAKELGLDEVRAGLTPEGKVEAIQSFRAGGKKVAMVGDGVNDAPSLAASDVSVAMGARGSDAALEQAEVILMHDRIENFLAALRLSLRARTIIRQNLAISLGVVVLMAIASIFGIVPLGVGVAAHEGSTVVVCLNSLRLLFGKNR
ncbi:MAG: heavy metal translocating P-type ATPase [Nibricoccus sp.]